jgi:hypothetical protein
MATVASPLRRRFVLGQSIWIVIIAVLLAVLAAVVL